MDPNASSITVTGMYMAHITLVVSDVLRAASLTTALLQQFECDRSPSEKLLNCEASSPPPQYQLETTDPGLTHNRVKNDDTTLFLGDGSMAAAPTPKLHQRGLRPVIKVVDDRCLYGPTQDKSSTLLSS